MGKLYPALRQELVRLKVGGVVSMPTYPTASLTVNVGAAELQFRLSSTCSSLLFSNKRYEVEDYFETAETVAALVRDRVVALKREEGQMSIGEIRKRLSQLANDLRQAGDYSLAHRTVKVSNLLAEEKTPEEAEEGPDDDYGFEEDENADPEAKDFMTAEDLQKALRELGMKVEKFVEKHEEPKAPKVESAHKPPRGPKALGKYYKQCRNRYKGTDAPEYCAKVSWSIYCSRVNPEYKGCTKYGKKFGPPYSGPLTKHKK